MLWSVLESNQKRRLLLFCLSYALLALVVAVPAAYAYHGQYDKDWGQVHCEKGKEAVQERARGNAVTVLADSGNEVTLVSQKRNTYSSPITKY